MDLKAREVADLLNVSESTICRWAVDGMIPAYRLNPDQPFMFSRNEIEDWLLSAKVSHQGPHMNEEMAAIPMTVKGNKQFSLYRAIHRGHVLRDLQGNSKEQIIRATMERIAKGMGLDPAVLTELLMDRERLNATALNYGIAVPHTRDSLLSVPYDVVTVVFLKDPIEYGALDGQPVHTLFFLFACDDKRHLHLLSKIAHFSSQPVVLDRLASRPQKEELLPFVLDWEGNLSLRTHSN